MVESIRRRLRSDDGIAMFAVIAVGGIAAALTVAALATTTGTLDRSNRDRLREEALHLAEGGANRALALITTTPSYSTGTAAPTPITRSWVLTQAASSTIEQGREGQFVWVVPAGQSVVFGVGYIPTRAAPRITRVVQVDYTFVRDPGRFSLLAAGDLDLYGNSSISIMGGVHSNRDLSLRGSTTVGGDATATGVYSAEGNPSVAGTEGGGLPTIAIPAVDPRTFRAHTTIDLCPDGTAKTTAATPCTGVTVGTGLIGYNGWTWTSSEWRLAGAAAVDGGYYVYQASVRITSSIGSTSLPLNMTIVTESTKVGGVKVNGDIVQTGSTHFRGRTDRIAWVADRDISISGYGSVDGLVMAGEQAELGGGGVISGQLTAAGSLDTAGSPVPLSAVFGNGQLVSRITAPPGTDGAAPRVWREL